MDGALVDLDAVAHNTRLLTQRLGTAALMAVVKADGFGHGAAQIARTALTHGASWLGVTSAAEALALRAEGIDAPTLSWLVGPDEDFTAMIGAGIDISVPAIVHLDAVATAAVRAQQPANVHLKVDTGLSRGGATPDTWLDLLAWAWRYEVMGVIRVRGVWSHLAKAEDRAHPSVAGQLTAFRQAVAQAREVGLRPLLHLANSAAILDVPEAHFDMARAGIALYGAEPIAGKRFGLRLAMTLSARAVLVKRVPAGTGVGYGHTYVTDRETTLALVPLGFADGVPARAIVPGEVLVRGVRRPIAGRVAMDQFIVDVGDLPVEVGDEVTVFGPGDRGEPTVSDWASWVGTNAQDILTGVGVRVPRVYHADSTAASTLERV